MKKISKPVELKITKIDICTVTCLKKIHFLYYKNIDFLCHIHDEN